jgi:hypothetical protein
MLLDKRKSTVYIVNRIFQRRIEYIRQYCSMFDILLVHVK